MAIPKKSSKRTNQGDLIVQLIGTLTEAMAKLITTSTSTIAILGILVILAIVVLRATPEMQQRIIPSLLSILSMMIGRMLAPQETSPPSHLRRPVRQDSKLLQISMQEVVSQSVLVIS